MTRQWLDLPLAALDPAPWRLHDQDDLVSRAKLAASLEHHGQVQALVVEPQPAPSGRYWVVDGRARLELMRAMGWTVAHCCSLGTGHAAEAGARVALSLQLQQRVSYPTLAGVVATLSNGYDTDRDAWAALARTTPFTPDDLRYYVALLDFDWKRFAAEPEPQALLDWGALDEPPQLLTPDQARDTILAPPHVPAEEPAPPAGPEDFGGDEYALPMATCPKCGYMTTDLDGFGFLRCDACGYCTHPSVDGDTCGLCGRVVSASGASGAAFEAEFGPDPTTAPALVLEEPPEPAAPQSAVDRLVAEIEAQQQGGVPQPEDPGAQLGLF